jgi:dTDP-4-amino-4,6-dideoxygalactose transaminase
VQQCGYEPYLLDVDADSWALDPVNLLSHPILERTGVVVPVAPYGRPIRHADWTKFREKTNIPVVIDAAAAFDTISMSPDRYLGDIPVCFSFHATKSFCCGEGGAVVCRDGNLIFRTMRALNFGFAGSRNSVGASTNGKMSEFHAAVGLAELDTWADKRKALRLTAQRYRAQMDRLGLGSRFILPPDIGATYALFRCQNADEMHRVMSKLAECRIEHRLWYGNGLHRETYFVGIGRDELGVTEHLTATVLGLPMIIDLSDSAIERIGSAVGAGLQARF